MNLMIYKAVRLESTGFSSYQFILLVLMASETTHFVLFSGRVSAFSAVTVMILLGDPQQLDGLQWKSLSKWMMTGGTKPMT